jgi:hypothetical protein
MKLAGNRRIILVNGATLFEEEGEFAWLLKREEQRAEEAKNRQDNGTLLHQFHYRIDNLSLMPISRPETGSR